MLVTLGVVGLGTAAVKTAADFDFAMSKVAAVSGATGSDLEANADGSMRDLSDILADCRRNHGDRLCVFYSHENATQINTLYFRGIYDIIYLKYRGGIINEGIENVGV